MFNPNNINAENKENTDLQEYKSKFVLSEHKAGHMEIGMSIDTLYKKYDRKLIQIIDLSLEGMFTPALEIHLYGKEKKEPSLVAEIAFRQGWIISRINVYDKRFKTDKNIGVGSSLGEIRKSYKVDWIDFGEGGLCARVEEISMTFSLNKVEIPKKWWKNREQTLISDTAEVSSVLVN